MRRLHPRGAAADQPERSIPEVAFDEAGNTGTDLLTPDQPVFVLASVLLSEEDANDVLEDVRPSNAKEVKFSRLIRSNAGRRRIIQAISESVVIEGKVRVTVVHKEFMVIAKMVDLLVEPLAHRSGLDLYQGGANVALSNLHYFTMSVMCGKARTRAFLERFVRMVRTGTTREINEFYKSAYAMYANAKSEEYAGILSPILLSERMIGEILKLSDRNSLDPAIPAFVEHCDYWGKQLGQLDVLHDESKPMFQERRALEDLMNRGGEEERVVGSDPRTMIFPLRVRRVRFGRSDEHARLQIADLFAGAMRRWMSGFLSESRRDEWWEQATGAGIGKFLSGAIWPMPHVTPEEIDAKRSGGVNAINYMADFLTRNR